MTWRRSTWPRPGAAADAGVRIALGTRYDGRRDGAFLLAGRDGPTRVRARFVVGADGARSRVARDLGLDRNRHLLVGAEEVFGIPASDEPPTFHCVLDPSLAPGYLAWVVNDGRHAHVGVAGYADRFPDGMRRALERFGASAPGLPASTARTRSRSAAARSPSAACCAGSAAPTGCSSATRPVRCPRSPPAVSIRACGCRSAPPTSWTTPCAPGGRTR